MDKIDLDLCTMRVDAVAIITTTTNMIIVSIRHRDSSWFEIEMDAIVEFYFITVECLKSDVQGSSG